MDTLKRLGAYLESRRGSFADPEVSLDKIVTRGERHLRNQRWLAAAGGAAGMLVFVFIGSLAFNSGDAVIPDGNEPATAAATQDDAVTATTVVPFGAVDGGGFDAIAETATASRGFGSADRAIFPGGIGEPVALSASTLSETPLDIAWQVTETGLGWTQQIEESGGLFYALSTAPGVTYDDSTGAGRLPQAVYVSADGAQWDAVPLDANFTASDLAVDGGNLYILGTAPGAASIGRSVDGGGSWEYAEVALSTTPPEGLGRIQGHNTSSRLAAGNGGVVAVLNTSYFVDYWGVIPIELHDRTKDRWPEATAEGVVLRDYSDRYEAEMACEEAMAAEGYPAYEGEEDFPAACTDLWNNEDVGEIIYTATWADLGFPDGVPSHVSELFYSADGSSFERITSPFSGTSHFSVFEATDDGFIAVEQDFERGGQTIWTSVDGRAWTAMTSAPQLSWVMDASAVPGGFALVGEANTGDGFGTVVSITTDGGATWSSIAAPGGTTGDSEYEEYTSGAAVGDFGVVVARSRWSYENEQESLSTVLYVSRDFQSWQRVDLTDVIDGNQYDLHSLAVAGGTIRFELQTWSNNDGTSARSTYVGSLG